MTDANTNFEALFAGLPEDILQCKLAGDFQNAVRLIDLRLQEQHLPQALRRCLTAEREMILRLPDEFPFSREEALALVRQHIPDFTEEEFDRFVDARKIRWIYRQGEPCYFGRFFDSLCKIDAGFARRAGVSLPGAESAGRLSEKEAQMDACIRQMKQKGSASRRIRIRASLQIPEEHFTPGMQVTAHLPIPLECDSQRGIRVERMFPENGILAPKDALQRTVCWQETLETNHAFMIEYSYTRTARYRDLWKGPLPAENPAKTLSEEELRPFLAEEPPHILFTPVSESSGGGTDGRRGPSPGKGPQVLRFYHGEHDLYLHALLFHPGKSGGNLRQKLYRGLRDLRPAVRDPLPLRGDPCRLGKRPYGGAGFLRRPRLDPVLHSGIRLALRGSLLRNGGGAESGPGTEEVLFWKSGPLPHGGQPGIPETL